MQRQVYIKLHKNTYFVLYVGRRPGQWHAAAQFYAPDHTLEQVKDWVAANPKLILCEGKNDGKAVFGDG